MLEFYIVVRTLKRIDDRNTKRQFYHIKLYLVIEKHLNLLVIHKIRIYYNLLLYIFQVGNNLHIVILKYVHNLNNYEMCAACYLRE